MSAGTTPLARRVSIASRVGLALAVAYAVVTLVQFAPAGIRDGDWLFIATAAVALVCLVTVPFAWRGAIWARITVVVTCLLPALSGVPAFFLPGLPAAAIVSAAVGLVWAVVAAVLVLTPGLRRPLPRRTALGGMLVLALCSLLHTGTPAAAASGVADPVACSATLARAAAWPGTVADAAGTRRVFSDAYYTNLLSRPACAGSGS